MIPNHYATLSSEQTALLWDHLHKNYLVPSPPPSPHDNLSASDLYPFLTDVDHAEIILSCANKIGYDWEILLSKLLNRPIYKAARGETGFPLTDIYGRPIPSPQGHRIGQEPSPSRSIKLRKQTRTSDPRVIVKVQPNPKRPGSEAHTRYQFYRVGQTVDEFLAAGGRRADIGWDSHKGFITLQLPSSNRPSPARAPTTDNPPRPKARAHNPELDCVI
jgi:hypothetical protein